MDSENKPCHSAPATFTYGQRQEPRKNEIPSESDGCTPGTTKKHLYLRPVMPFSSGEGLPYAPVDWPSPGDNWRWKVGRRISKTGFFFDRFLYPPYHLQKPGCPKLIFAGRPTLEQYIRTEFPAADVDAFFASFSWKVRAHMGGPSKVNTAPRPRKKGPKEDKEWEENEETTRTSAKKRKPKPAPVLSTRRRPKEDKEWEENEQTTGTSAKKRKPKPAPVPSTRRRQTRQSFKRYFPSTTKHEVITIDLTEETDTSTSLTKDLASASDIENDEVSSNQNSDSSAHYSSSTSLSHVPSASVMDARLVERDLDSTTQDPSASVIENERVEAQMKLSSLLAMDFPLLISTEKLTELTSQLSKVQEDPHLTLVQLHNMIEEIRLISKYFLEAKQDMEAEECFADLEANLICLNKQYKQSQENAAQIEAEINSSISAKQEIEDQVAQLQSRCVELDTDIGLKTAAKNDLLSAQRELTDSLSSVKHKVKLQGESRKQELELKKADAAKRVTEIIAKYASS